MRYALDLTDDARGGFVTLPVAVQEEVLDALDRIAANPDLLVERRPLFPDAAYAFVSAAGPIKYYVFIVAQRDRVDRVVRIKKIASVIRQA